MRVTETRVSAPREGHIHGQKRFLEPPASFGTFPISSTTVFGRREGKSKAKKQAEL
ncbi:unnamed protein product [Sphenostylis stenocarpa]|uniref:Uncharacterized protein n=1 Tax=Sphenostylis stenocarpa TaxID=92480 RepID=A0AA86S7J4_9FABA|nr:unnamed protein product [Sphenostylis stenocarpa]